MQRVVRHHLPLVIFMRDRLPVVGGLFVCLLSICLSHADTAPEPVVDLQPYPVVGADPWSPALRAAQTPGALLVAGNWLEAPRAVSWLSAERMASLAIDRIESVATQIPGGYAPARFGVVSLPSLRGDVADWFVNGQRRSGNQFGFRPGWNAVDAVEIVRGPPTVVQGPGKNGGGMLNMIGKQANPAATSTTVSSLLGNWLPDGGSYANYRLGLDHNQRLGDRSAVRASLEWQDDATRYAANGGRNDHVDVWLAYSLRGAGSRLDVFAQALWQDSPQLLGVNRPWQGLIDDNRYLSGSVDPLIGVGNPPGFLDPGIADPGLLTATPAEAVVLPEDATLLSQGDLGTARVAFVQVIWQQELAPDWQWVQRTFVDHVNREKANAFLFLEDVTQWSAETRTEVTWAGGGSAAVIGSQTLGGAVRWERRENYTNYWNEFAYAFDITTARRFDALATFPTVIAPGAQLGPRGLPYYSPSSGLWSTPETVASNMVQGSAFWEGEFRAGRHVVVSAGLRADTYAARARDPLLAPGTTQLRDNDRFASASHSLNIRWQPTARATLYLTHARVHALAANTVGDGISLYGDGRMREADFNNRNTLWELGWRQIGRDPANWWSVTVFDQQRTRREFFGPSDLAARGIELDGSLRIAQRLVVFGNAAYLDAHYIASSPAEFGGSSLGNVYAPGTGPDGLGNGLGYIGGFFLNSLPPGDYRLPGVSRWQVQAGARWQPVDGLTAVAWALWRSAQDGNLRREFTIPAQLTINLSLTLERGPWSWSVDCLNAANARNWVHNGDTFFNQLLISRELPRRLQARASYRF
jgi:hypothetical protein